MCAFPSDERLNNIVEGTYYDSKGKRCEGAFLTVDDAYLLVNVNVFDRLVNQATHTVAEEVKETNGVLSYEEAKAQFGDRIIQEYLADQDNKKKVLEEEKKDKVEQSKDNRTIKARQTKIKNADTKKKEILRLILKGTSPVDIMKELNYSSSIVYRAIKSFDHDFVFSCYNNDFVKEGIIKEADFMKFVNLDYNYKSYLKYIKGKIEKKKSEKKVVRKNQVVTPENLVDEKVQDITRGINEAPALKVEDIKKEDESYRGMGIFPTTTANKDDEDLPPFMKIIEREKEREQARAEAEIESHEYYRSRGKAIRGRDLGNLGKLTTPVHVVNEPKKPQKVASFIALAKDIFGEAEYDGEVDEWGFPIN